MTKSFKWVLAAGAACIMAAPALADVKAGVDAWGRGDYENAVKEWRPAAIAGNMDAQFNLGQAYKLGRGVTQDLAQAEEWYRKAALQGHEKAEDNYGLTMFQGGKRKEALPWIEKSAARGEPRAQYILGTALFNGDGMNKDWVRAYALMTRASASGLSPASSSLAQMDKFIPMDQRQKGLKLAQELEQSASRQQIAQAPVPQMPVPVTNKPVSRDVEIPGSQPPLADNRGANFPANPAPVYVPQNGPIYVPQPISKPVPAPAPEPEPAPTPAPVFKPKPAPVVKPKPVPTPAPAPAVSSGGSWRIQLGAFSEQDRAEALWDRLEPRYSVLGDLQPFLVNIGRVTKLQAGGFSSEAAASKACASLRASGQACIPVPKGR
jgi:cell division septation protein DedD